ncbi:MAG: hypothetical protein QF440_07395 [Candidatus Thalassarchaeaceae archaeon]|nr:hypothetical protein [Candidatus Thalassarchaeaceae archaeon]
MFVNTGDSVQLSVSAYDADGDSMSGSLSWGDGMATDWSTSIPNSASHTYSSTGIYHVGAVVQDDVDSSYSAPLTVIVTPDTSALESLSIVSSDSMVDEGGTVSFTLSSSNPSANLDFVFDDGNGNLEDIQPTSGHLSSVQRQITYDIPGDYTPNILAYDSQSNLLGYEEISIRVLPDYGNGTVDPSQFQIIGDGVLIVLDDNGYELSAAERTEDYQNSNISSMALLQAVAKVATIRNESMEIHIVGDTDLDGVVDSPGANGPGLNILRHYSTVLWTTGGDWSSPLTEFDEAVLTTYVRSAGSLILFSQDYLYSVNDDVNQNDWALGSFAYDILGIGSSDQDIGEPTGDLQISDGGGTVNGAYLPLAGIESISIDSLQAAPYQDHISREESMIMPCEYQGFESSSLSNSRSTFVDCNTGADVTSQYGQGSISWTTWSSHWMRDCTYYYSGSCSYKSAPTSHNGGKQMRAYVPASSTSQQISFYFMVSTQANHDELRFIVNGGNPVQVWSGSQGWTQYQYTLPASNSQTTLEWWYVKDGSGTSGADTVWIDQFFICCDVGVSERLTTLEILSDGTSNYGVAHHALADADNDGVEDTTTHTAFITLDPVQFEYKYDLETTLLQLVDWSTNRNPIGSTPGGGIHASDRANWLPVGIDMMHPSAHSQGGEQWYNVRLFEGQNILIESNIYNLNGQPSRANYDIYSFKIFDPDGVSTLGTATTSDDWVIDYTADSTGIHQIRIELDYTGTQETLPSPWYQMSLETLSDSYYPTLVLDGPAVHDAISPQNWTLSTDDHDDYSSTPFNLGTLQNGEIYGLTFTSSDTSSSHSLDYVLFDVGWYSMLLNQSLNGDNDNDGDGIANDIDTDDDNDGIPDESDATPYDRDGDGINDADDDDDDGNGIDDIIEIVFEIDSFVLESSYSHTQLIQVSGTKQVGLVVSNSDAYNHPLLGTFGYDVELWSLPAEDDSDLATGAYQLTEDFEESFWVSSIADLSDTFTVDVAWDEGMVVEFESDSIPIGAVAEVSCGVGPFNIIELEKESIIEINCEQAHTYATIVISSDSQLMEYSLLYKRNDAVVEILMDTPMFGINQVDDGSDFWNLVSAAPGQLIDIYGDEGGSIKFYNHLGQVVKTEDVNRTTDIINIPSNVRLFSVSNAGGYGFIVIEPNHPTLALNNPEPVVIGEMITIEVASSQAHNLDSMSNSNRVYDMWDLSTPVLEFTTSSPYILSNITESTNTIGSWPSVSASSSATISVNSNDLGVGEHSLTFDLVSSWSGTSSHEVTLVVDDLEIDPVADVSDLTATQLPGAIVELQWSNYPISLLQDGDYASIYYCTGSNCDPLQGQSIIHSLSVPWSETYSLTLTDGETYNILVQLGRPDSSAVGQSASVVVTADGSVSPSPIVSAFEVTAKDLDSSIDGTDALGFTWSASDTADVSGWMICWAGYQFQESDWNGLVNSGTGCVQTYGWPTGLADDSRSADVTEQAICGGECNGQLYFGIAGIDVIGNIDSAEAIYVYDATDPTPSPPVCCFDDDDDDDDDSDQDSQVDNLDDDDDKEGAEEESSQKSDSDTPQTMLIVIGSVVVLLILLCIASMMVIRRKRGGEIILNHQMPSMEQWDTSMQGMMPTSPPVGAVPMAAPIFSQTPTAPPVMQQLATPVSTEPEVPSRVNSYLELVGGGEYSTDERGTIYTDPTGYEWVQLADGSFVRLS